jgi:hypothetical protein
MYVCPAWRFQVNFEKSCNGQAGDGCVQDISEKTPGNRFHSVLRRDLSALSATIASHKKSYVVLSATAGIVAKSNWKFFVPHPST